MQIHLTYHILIHMLIHASYISFIHAYTSLILTHHIMFHFLSSFIYIFLLVHVTVYLSLHSSVMLLISFHIMSFIIFRSFAYSCRLFLCFMSAYTLKVDTGNYKGPKALLSLYDTMTFIRARRRCYHCTRQ